MDIAVAHVELVKEIHDQYLMVAANAGGPIGKLSAELEDLSIRLEGLGICHLLEAADTGEFAENLVRSGHARRWFLKRSQAEGHVADRRLALSRTTTFLDALVAGDLSLARDIAALSRPLWQPTWEYEEDFCFFAFLHGIAVDPAPRPDQVALLDRFEKALEGGDSTRLPVCRALVARDRAAFTAALEEHMEAEQDAIDEERGSARVLEGDPAFWPASFVSIEGLALLKAAELVGMPPPDEIPRCPDLGRLPTRPNQYRDFFAGLDEA